MHLVVDHAGQKVLAVCVDDRSVGRYAHTSSDLLDALPANEDIRFPRLAFINEFRVPDKQSIQ
jgi:hypothetical protein